MFHSKHVGNSADSDRHALRCSFCNKTKREVRKIIAGPAVFICDECVQVCVDIIEADDRATGDSHAQARAADDRSAARTGPGPVSAQCILCDTLTPTPALVWIPDRGGLCPSCLAQIDAILAERRHPR